MEMEGLNGTSYTRARARTHSHKLTHTDTHNTQTDDTYVALVRAHSSPPVVQISRDLCPNGNGHCVLTVMMTYIYCKVLKVRCIYK